MTRAKIQSIKEPLCLDDNGKRPDGASLIPWQRGKCVTWDVTVTYQWRSEGPAGPEIAGGPRVWRARQEEVVAEPLGQGPKQVVCGGPENRRYASVTYTYAKSYIAQTKVRAGAAAERAAVNKTNKYM